MKTEQLSTGQLIDELMAQGVELWPDGDQLRCRGPQRLLTPALLETLSAQKDRILDQLHRGAEVFPLAYGQWVFWFEHQVSATSAAFNVSLTLDIHGAVDADAMARALQMLVNRHPMLRTTFGEQDGAPVQRVHQYQAVTFTTEDVTALSHDEIDHLVKAHHAQPFDLADGPVFRAVLFQRGDEEAVLLCSAHHIVCDGLSLWTMLDELPKLYQIARHGEGEPLPPVPARFSDYVAWQRDLLAREGDELLAYWREQLDGAAPALDLETDFPRPPTRTYAGATHPFTLNAARTEQLRALARAEGVTLYMVLLAAYQVLLHRYTQQDDILVDTTMMGRSEACFHNVIGNFFAPVVMRGRLDGNPTFRAFLQQVRQTTIEALAHQDYPFPLLVEKLRPVRDPARPPLTQVSFGLHKPLTQSARWLFQPFVNGDRPSLQWDDWQVTPRNIGLLEGMFELDLELFDLDETLRGFLVYNTDLFSEATAARMTANFVTLLDAIIRQPETPIGALPLLSDEERRQLLAGGSDHAEATSRRRPVHQLFEEQAQRTPDADALIVQPDGGSPVHVTYAELNQQANRLAHHLRGLGIGPGTLAGICVAPSVEMVVGLLAILKAGGAYVPMDPSYPAQRLQQMVEEAGMSVLLTQAHLRARLPATGVPLVILDEQPAPWADRPDDNVRAAVSGDDLIYAIFTSGSTGRPKGAGVYHRGFTNLTATWYVDELAMTPQDRVLLMTSFSFDLTQKNFYAPLIAGGTLVIADLPYFDPTEFCQVIRAHAISWLNCTPSMFHHLLDAAADSDAVHLPSLRTVVLGGEPIAVERVAAWAASRPRPPRVINSYGPTECTDVCAAHVLDLAGTDYAGGVPIGRPIANVRLYILDADLQLAPMGAVGELCIGGVGVGAGYLNDAALTAAKFVDDHHVPAAGRLYRTGDLAKFLPNGDILFLGRMDNQVKLRGMRIELGDIEATLAAHPAVREAVVVLQPRADATRLVAYLVAGVADARPDLRAYVENRLPAYMVPAAFVYLDQLPLTPSGKVDRQALAQPDAKSAAPPEPAPVSPRSALEAELAALWSREMGLEQVDVNASFFALGGDSFSAIRIVTALKAKGYNVPLRRVFEQPTIAGLAGILAEEQPDTAAPSSVPPVATNGSHTHEHGRPTPSLQSKAAGPRIEPPLVPIQPNGSRPPLFCVHPVMGVSYPYYQLAHHLDPEQPVFALQSVGLEPGVDPDVTIEGMAERYVAAMRAHWPHGPYRLCGWSFGGWVAYEMAVQLQAAGEEVALLAVIDAIALTRQDGRWAQRTSNLALTGVIARNIRPFIMPYIREFRALADPQGPEDGGSASLWQAARTSLRVLAANNRATFAYEPTPEQYAGPLTLLRTARQVDETRPDLGWAALCRQEVQVVRIAGNHMTALREPHVADLGRRLQSLLDAAEQKTSPRAREDATHAGTRKAAGIAATPAVTAASVATAASAPAETRGKQRSASAPVPAVARAANGHHGQDASTRPMTGDEYLESLRDGREVWIYGARVEDVTAHPAFRNQARMVARLYDMLHDPAGHASITTPTDTGSGGYTHAYFRAAYTQAEQVAARDALAAWHRVGFGWMGRAPDYMAGLLGLLGANADLYAPFDENARRWYRTFQERMPYVNHALVNPPVDRHRPPDEVDDVYIHVVRETDAGIVVSGAKNITTNAALTNYSFVAHDGGAPVKRREFAATFLLPVNTPGVKMICRPSYEMRAGGAGTPFDYPLSGRFDENDAIFILDEVLVPWENVLIYGDLEKYNKHMRNSGFYSRSGLQSATRMAVKLDLITGLLLKATETTGVQQFRGVQVNIGEVMTYRHLFWALSDALAHSAVAHNGVVIPKLEHMMAHRMMMTTAYPRVREIVSQLVASGLIFHPSSARDFQTPELQPYLEKYMRGSNTDAVTRTKLMKTLWDAVGTEFGGRHELYERNNLGNHEAIRLHAHFQSIADGTEESLKAFADTCLDEFDLDGWTADDLINPER